MRPTAGSFKTRKQLITAVSSSLGVCSGLPLQALLLDNLKTTAAAFAIEEIQKCVSWSSAIVALKLTLVSRG